MPDVGFVQGSNSLINSVILTYGFSSTRALAE